jgi:hypothetical protein
MGSVHFITINNFSNIPVTRFIIEAVAKKYVTNVADTFIKRQYNLENVSKHVNLLPKTAAFPSMLLKYYNVWRFLNSELKKKDILYTPDYQVFSFFFIWKSIFRKQKISVIYHPFELTDEAEMGRISRWMWNMTLKKAQQDVAFTVFPEKNRRDYFCRLAQYPISRTLVLANSTLLAIQPDVQPHERFFKEGVTVIGHIGSLGPDHYVEVLVELLEKNRFNEKIGFLVVGNYIESVRSKLLGANNPRLVLIEKVPHSELGHFYHQIDYGLILYKALTLNFDYCAPNKLYEYFSYGIPVLAHPLRGLTYLDLPQDMLHLIDFDSNIFSNQVNTLLNKINTSKEDIRQKFVKFISVEKELDKLLPVIDSVMNEK